jgi:hypothetical protein
MEAFLHHVEIGHHHKEQHPERHEAYKCNAKNGSIALKKAFMGGIVSEL